jgi:hypothetical protein
MKYQERGLCPQPSIPHRHPLKTPARSSPSRPLALPTASRLKSFHTVSTWKLVVPNAAKSPCRSHVTVARVTALARIWKWAV